MGPVDRGDEAAGPFEGRDLWSPHSGKDRNQPDGREGPGGVGACQSAGSIPGQLDTTLARWNSPPGVASGVVLLGILKRRIIPVAPRAAPGRTRCEHLYTPHSSQPISHLVLAPSRLVFCLAHLKPHLSPHRRLQHIPRKLLS